MAPAASPDESPQSSTKKWKSLFQLSSSGGTHHRQKRALNDDGDNTFMDEPHEDELQDDDLFLTSKKSSKCQAAGSRRPSAPAILVDFKNFLTNAVTRRSSSSYGLCTSTSSKDNIYNIPTDPIHLVALKEHSPSINVEEENLPLSEPPHFPPIIQLLSTAVASTAAVTSEARLEPPPLHKAAKKHWIKTFSDNSCSLNPLLSTVSAAVGGSSSSLTSATSYSKHHLPHSQQSNVSSTDSLLSTTKDNKFIVVNRLLGDDISSSKNNCQKTHSSQQSSLLLSKTKSLSTGSIGSREISSEVPSSLPPPPNPSDSFIPAAVKSSSTVGVQEQQTRTPESPAIVTKPRFFQKRQRDIVQDASDSEECGDDLYLRRHTIASVSSAMTVAAYGMVICGGTDDLHGRYRGRIEKVKFGVPINEAFSHDIPATLLVLLLKVNKEGPLKKDIWRAPGNQAQVRKLSHIMQHGRLVNISNISVYTAASVIKKFLSKLPGGIFGSENEQELFGIVQQPDNDQQRNVFCRVICNLSVPSQHLLVLLFGTFRIISDSADTFGTRMTPEAIGISVAPSLFHTCIHDNQRAKLEDVMRFKLASQVISKIIQGFGYTNLFPRECYEFYARITGRTLRVDEHWHFTFQYPSITGTFSQPAIHRACDSPTEGGGDGDADEPGPSGYNRRRNTDCAAGSAGNSSNIQSSNIEPLEKEFAGQRLSASMGEVLIHTGYESDVPERMLSNQCPESFESTRSLTYLEWVHEKQTKRMRTRSEWFLSPVMPTKNNGASKSVDFKQHPFDNRSLLIPKSSDLGMSSTEDMQISPIPKTLASSSDDEPVTPRQPFQEIQESSTPTLPTSAKSSHSGSEATTPLAKNQASIFFSQAQGGPILPAVVAVAPSPRVVSSSGVVRRKSWRTHYVRPNKSFDQETTTAGGQDIIESSSHSTPARRSSTGMPLAEFEVVEARLPESARALIRRKSSGSNNGKGKIPVQSRKSTQI